MAKNKISKVVVDTNLWVSFIISKKLGNFEKQLIENKLRLLFSHELIDELRITFSKPKLQNYFPPHALEEMLDVFEPYIDLITVKSKVTICRDPKDNFLLELAKDGKANYLITGDKDLLEIGNFEGIYIVTITDFLTTISP